MKKIGAKIFVNSITMLRVIGTFLMPIVSVKFNAQKLVTYIIVLLVTDSVDGMLARRLKVSTLFGALLDATADKLLGIATIVVLARWYPIMILPIITEILTMIINTNGALKGARIESSKLGKFKTWVLGVCTVIGFLTLYAEDFILLFSEETSLGLKIINIFEQMINNPTSIINGIAFISFGAGLMVAFDYGLRVKKDVAKAKEQGLEAKKYKLKKGKDLKEALFDEDFYQKTKNEPVLTRLGYLEV